MILTINKLLESESKKLNKIAHILYDADAETKGLTPDQVEELIELIIDIDEEVDREKNRIYDVAYEVGRDDGYEEGYDEGKRIRRNNDEA